MADSITDLEPGFTTTLGIYQFCEDVSQMDLIDQMQARSSQLVATLGMITGEGIEHFASLTEEVQEGYLWGCQLAAKEIQGLIRALVMAQARDAPRP